MPKTKKGSGKKSMFLCSGSDDVNQYASHFRKFVKRFLKRRKVNIKKHKIHVLAFADAAPGGSILDHYFFKDVCKQLKQMGCKLHRSGYRFYHNLKGRGNCSKYLRRKGTIAVVFGGNTYQLNNGLSKVPGIRKCLKRRVRKGRVLYTSFSAGSVCAGTSVEICMDPLIPNPRKSGLGLWKALFRPHDPAGRGHANAIRARQNQNQIRGDNGKVIKHKIIEFGDGGPLAVVGKRLFRLNVASDKAKFEKTV